MVRIHIDEIKRRIDEEADEFDGTDILDGSDPAKIGNPSERLEKVIGNKPDPEKKGFSIAEEIDSDEAALREE